MSTTTTSPTITAQTLTGRTALVTGAGSGIGAGVAAELAAAGAHVVVNDYAEDAALATVDDLTSHGYAATAAVGDITDPDSVARIISDCEALSTTGGLDILINNAGITGKQHVDDLDLATWNRVLAVNLTAPFTLALAALPGMRAQGRGRIINIASIAGIRVSVLGGAAYTASKSGVLGLTRHLASELAADGITANAILPGVTLTPMVEQATDAATRAKVAASVPVGRMATPADIGRLAVWFAADTADNITGTAVPLDGGMTVLPGDYTEYRATRGES